MSTIAKSNGNHLPDGLILALDEEANNSASNDDQSCKEKPATKEAITAELFPTVVRNAALGSATQAAQMGAILAPFVVVLGGALPFAVFAFCGIMGGLLAFYLPETLNRPLYDTMTGMEDGESGCRSV
ncbi:hypothetical protein P3X46_027113 [Hevea brasiliensis]|uniref:Major facilitator superfamily (MFS) profile domain-containing protein n=1 Tax=Hevea brasiliensis TaxID=3981 RepID=A0ABQ9KYT8_HEVBR|nr:hypothetical protein P3X46_027113 [Hevea brasiliensis]